MDGRDVPDGPRALWSLWRRLEWLGRRRGCDRAQLELAVQQSHPEAPAKVALLWAARSQLGLLPMAELRSRCDELLANPLVVPSFRCT